jgi:hypothetical protein
MSRKEPSFAQLIDYMSNINKADEKYNIYQNLYSHKTQDIENEFKENAENIANRKNGVYLYHEILSISDSQKLEREQQKEILRDIAQQYAQTRASNNLVFATLHDDHEEHLHYHFLISSNALGESKKTRLSKKEFDSFKKNFEKQTLETYPELEQEITIGKQAKVKLSNKGAERKRRTGKTPQRDEVKDKLHTIFNQTSTKQEFFNAMNDAQFEVYLRGKTIGILDKANNRKHRLKTLGVLDDFNTMSKRINLDEKTQNDHKKTDKKSEQKSEKKSSEKSSKQDTKYSSDYEKVMAERYEKLQKIKKKRQEYRESKKNHTHKR